MARDSGVSPNAPHVSLTGGGAVEKGLGGHERDEGVALLVTDTGRADFSATTHPQLTVGTTAVSLNTVHSDNREVSAKRGFLLKASTANSGSIFVGTSTVTVSSGSPPSGGIGIPLLAGESMFIEITTASNIYLRGSASNQVLYWLDM